MVSRRITAYVGLGSNLGDRAAHLGAAIAALRAVECVEVRRISSVWETEPVGGPPQGSYLNAVVALETGLSASELLGRLQAIEAAAGRERSGTRDAPRTLDLDLLFYGAEIIEEPGLEVPHPRLHQRVFVLEPLREIAPELVHPRLGTSLEELARRARGRSAARRVG